MATVNIGNIKLNWKGAYNGSTAYAIDDVVSYNGSSYVCIQASTGNLPTVTAYWEQMSQKGTDADLINITGTVQGDIYYNNGGAIARLGAGTSGQFLKTQGTGANPVWGTVEGISVAQQFRLAGDQAGSGSNGSFLTNWEENDTDYQAIGSSWSQSSGVFSTTSTGIYLCNWTLNVYGSGSGDGFDPNIRISTDSGSTYNIRSQVWGHTDASTPHDVCATTFIFDVANASNFRLRFHESESNDVGSASTIKGSTSKNYTQITFVRLGAT
jgi:hypothetical protein